MPHTSIADFVVLRLVPLFLLFALTSLFGGVVGVGVVYNGGLILAALMVSLAVILTPFAVLE